MHRPSCRPLGLQDPGERGGLECSPRTYHIPVKPGSTPNETKHKEKQVQRTIGRAVARAICARRPGRGSAGRCDDARAAIAAAATAAAATTAATTRNHRGRSERGGRGRTPDPPRTLRPQTQLEGALSSPCPPPAASADDCRAPRPAASLRRLPRLPARGGALRPRDAGGETHKSKSGQAARRPTAARPTEARDNGPGCCVRLSLGWLLSRRAARTEGR